MTNAFASRKLSENNTIPESHIPTVLNILRTKINDEHDDSRNYALYTISNLIEHRMIPSTRLDEITEILLSRLHDGYQVASHNALWGMSMMAENNLISENYVSSVIQNMLAICYDSEDSTRYNNAIFTLFNLAKGKTCIIELLYMA